MRPPSRSAISFFGLIGLAVVAAGCFDPLVGYPCAEGYTACGEICANIETSKAHCGQCGAVCSGVCLAGICSPDGGADDGGSDARDGGDANRPETTSNDRAGTGGTGGSAADAGRDAPDAASPADVPVDMADDTGGSDARPVDMTIDVPVDMPMTMVDAGVPMLDAPVEVRDTADASVDVVVSVDLPVDLTPDVTVDVPVDLPVDLTVDVAPDVACDGGMTACTDRCANLPDDPDNCGACATRCGSGLCASGVCQQQGAGHVVVIGHDYVMNRTSMNNLLGNAVFLAAEDPIKVLAFEGEATMATLAGANQAIDDLAALRGRRWTRATRTSGTLAADLQSFDVLLIYAQYGSSNATLTSHGSDWAAALTTFLNSGHTIVLLDGISPNNSGTYRILTGAGLFAATGQTAVTGETLTVFNPSDAIAARVTRTYRAEFTSVSFTSGETAKVVTTSTGAPVVVHKTY